MKHGVFLPVRWQEHSAVPSNLQKTLQINQYLRNVLTQFFGKKLAKNVLNPLYKTAKPY